MSPEEQAAAPEATAEEERPSGRPRAGTGQPAEAEAAPPAEEESRVVYHGTEAGRAFAARGGGAVADGPGAPAPEGTEMKYYEGMWGNIPNFKCPYCPYASIGLGDGGTGHDAIQFHIDSMINAGEPRHWAAAQEGG